MKKILLIIVLILGCNFSIAQVNVYWRGEATTGSWEWGSSCDANASDGNWYYSSPWGGNRRRPDCYAFHYVHIDNNNQVTMDLNGNDDFSVNQLLFDATATSARTINTSNSKKIFFKNTGAKTENYSSATHVFNVDISLDTNTEFNPIGGNLTLNNTINTFGYYIAVYGNSGKTLAINGAMNGAGGLTLKDNTTVVLSGANTYTGTTTVEGGVLQLNNAAGALPAANSVTVSNSGTLRISKNQVLNNITLNNTATLIIDAGAVLTINGAVSGSGTITNNGTLVLNPSGSISFPGAGITVSAMNSFTVSSGTVSLTANVAPQNLSVTGGTLNLGSYTANRASSGGALSVSSGAALQIGSTNTLPSNFASHTFGTTSTVQYNGAAQVIAVPAGSSQYGNVLLSGSGQKTLAGSVAAAGGVTLQAGTALTVSTGKTLTVAGQLVNNATPADFVIQDNAALLQGPALATGGITVHKNSNALYRLDYTLWSSPVSGQALSGFSPLTSTDRFYTYTSIPANATTTSGHYQTVSNINAAFADATGYLIRTPDTGTTGYAAGTEALTIDGVFTGTPHNGNVTVALNTTGDKFTAVGNPYPSPIGVAEVFAAGSGVLDGSSPLYFWRKRNNSSHLSYYSVTASSYTANSQDGGTAITGFTGAASTWTIAPGQGFFVKAGAGSSFTFTNSMRKPATATQAFFRSEEATGLSRLWINLTDANNNFSQASIAYLAGATTGLDYSLDGAAFSISGTSIYTTAENKALAIQTRPAFNPADKVTVGFTVPASGKYTIKLDHFDGVFTDGQQVFIKDNLTGITHNLTEGAYSFTTDAGNLETRFEVVYVTDGSLGTQNAAFNANEIIVYRQDALLKVDAGTQQINSIEIYDIQGRKLYAQSNVNATTAVIANLTAWHEMLVVKVATGRGTASKKVIF